MRAKLFFFTIVLFVTRFAFSAHKLEQDFAAQFPGFSFKPGMVIGISEVLYDHSTIAFELATGSRFGHVGVVLKIGKEWRVAHSDPANAQWFGRRSAVSDSSLWDFLKKGYIPAKKKFLVSIIEPIEEIDADKLHHTFRQNYIRFSSERKEYDPLLQQEVHHSVGIQHHFSYNFSQIYDPTEVKNRLNCSEFVHHLLKDYGLRVGHPQKMKTLNLNALNGVLLSSYLASGRYDDEALVLTPKSVMQSAVDHPVYNPDPVMRVTQVDALQVAKTYTSREIVQAWYNDGYYGFVVATLPFLTFTDSFTRQFEEHAHQHKFSEMEP